MRIDKSDIESNKNLGIRTRRYGPGYVYLMQERGTNRCKIGISIKPKQRLVSLNYSLPFDVDLICATLVPSMKEAEDYWHEIFESRHIKGEWFMLRDDDIELFKSCPGNHKLSYEVFYINQWYWERNNDT